MSKELGYIKIEDVLELVKLVHRVHMETDNYVGIELCNNGYSVLVTAHKGRFRTSEEFDLFEFISLYDPKCPQHEVNQYCKIRDYLKGLLGEL